MHTPKGFGKNYFTLSAIQAHSTQPLVHQIILRVEAYRLQIAQEDELILEEDDPELLLVSASLSLPHSSGRSQTLNKAIAPFKGVHCNCLYLQITDNHLHLNSKPKLLISPYLFANSALSPPYQISISLNNLNE